MGTHRISFGQRSRAGFTIIELAIVIVVISLLLMPLLRIAASSIGTTRTLDTGAALETARDALVAFAASNNGCLPFAADFEAAAAPRSRLVPKFSPPNPRGRPTMARSRLC